MATHAGVRAQSTTSKTLNDVLVGLRSKYGIQFSYKAQVAKNLQLQVPENLENEPNVDVLLTKILAPSGLSYKKVNDVYIIIKKETAVPGVAPLKAAPSKTSTSRQDQTVRGTVTDGAGNALPGVAVVVKGTSRGTSTDLNGNFTLAVPANSTLVFNYLGFQTQEIAVGNQAVFNIALQTDTRSLQEVVVVGYGTQKKSDVTGSVTSVSSEEFVEGQVTSAAQLITGKVAGVQVTSNGGEPGAGSRIRIRGGASLSASNDPLIVIDGVPIENTSVAGAANPLSFINPDDIESFNILKDASAAAIYGSRASNGVIIITTKKGKAGQKQQVKFSTQFSVAKIKEQNDVLSADQYRQVVNEQGTPEQIALLGDANTNWQDQIFQEALTTDNNFSLTGADNNLPYHVSVGYLSQEGILKTSKFNRASGSVSLSPSLFNDHLKVNLNVKGAITNSFFADFGAIGAAVAFDPTQPVYNSENAFGGYFQWTDANGNYNTLATRNPLSMLEQRDDEGFAKRSIGNAQFDYKFHFLPDLRANLNLGYDISSSNGRTFFPAEFAPNAVEGGRLTRYEQSKRNHLMDFYLNYVKELTSISSRVDLTAGYSFQDFETNNPAFPVLNATGALITEAGRPGQIAYRLKSYFGRVNYSLMDRYLLTATVRTDGSSRFSEDNRWGTFPALAFAWRISEEGFLSASNTVSDLKLRVGYGVTGQQDIGESVFPYLARYTLGDNTAQYQLGFDAQGRPIYYTTFRPEGYDVGLKWEETKTYNAGLDFGFFNNRITGSLDYFLKDTEDLLATVDVAAGSNLVNRLPTNVGNLTAEGIEAVLGFTAIDNEKLVWDVGVNATYITREITKLSNVEVEGSIGNMEGTIAGGTGNRIQVNTVGYAPFTYYVYKQVYDESGKPIEGLYADLDGNGVIDENDKYRYKNPEANVNLGFNSSLTYGNWNFSLVARASLGNYMYNNVYSNNGAYQAFRFPNYLTNISPNVLETNFQTYQYFSDYYVENASFLRMENMNLSYNFGRVMNDRMGLRVSANVSNAFVITEYRGLDPEIAGGIDNNFYPRPRVFTLGVSVEL
ncbi:SusC/RagA family TonB-linked outer membrane protein [Pontibacter akesuensis]|nr:TonB-dependent receptor [Pontibacter akesuensis]GHA55293.1 SusC/RagA family TonB-linked outer membrane protein [Pontibacter akesuensis]